MRRGMIARQIRIPTPPTTTNIPNLLLPTYLTYFSVHIYIYQSIFSFTSPITKKRCLCLIYPLWGSPFIPSLPCPGWSTAFSSSSFFLARQPAVGVPKERICF